VTRNKEKVKSGAKKKGSTNKVKNTKKWREKVEEGFGIKSGVDNGDWFDKVRSKKSNKREEASVEGEWINKVRAKGAKKQNTEAGVCNKWLNKQRRQQNDQATNSLEEDASHSRRRRKSRSPSTGGGGGEEEEEIEDSENITTKRQIA